VTDDPTPLDYAAPPPAMPGRSRAVVFYGEGHAYLLRQCIIEAPGVDLVEANDYLPK